VNTSSADSAGSDHIPPAFARTVLTIANDTERAERELRQEIITAARAGDCNRVIDIVLGWDNMPPLDALRQLRSATPCEL
jgi:hypothetical protein